MGGGRGHTIRNQLWWWLGGGGGGGAELMLQWCDRMTKNLNSFFKGTAKQTGQQINKQANQPVWQSGDRFSLGIRPKSCMFGVRPVQG